MTDALHHIIALAPQAPGIDMEAAKVRAAAAELARTAGTGFSTLLLAPDASDLPGVMAGERQYLALCDHISGLGGLAQVVVDALAALSARMPGQPMLVLAPPGPDGEALAARVAAKAGFQPLGRCEKLVLAPSGMTVTSQRGGRIRRDIACAGSATAVLRPAAVTAELPCTAPPEVLPSLGEEAGGDLPVERLPLAERQANLEGARLVVSGGRGLDADGFVLLTRIADRLGGAVGASLPAIDLGLAPVSRQVGQSGKFVSPDIYLAVGLSGTPQHMAGVAPLSRIIAINSDPQAPIFQFAELGLVADWRDALPALLAALD